MYASDKSPERGTGDIPKASQPFELPAMPVTPTYDKIIIKVNRVDRSPGGLQYPDDMAETNKDNSLTAWVIAVGPDCKQVKHGDLIVCATQCALLRVKYAGVELHCILHEEEVVAVVNGANCLDSDSSGVDLGNSPP